MEPAPTEPVPIIGGGHSPVALRRTAALCDGWIAAGAYSEDEAWIHLAELRDALKKAGRDEEGFTIYLSLNERPDVDLYRRFADAGVTDFVCAPWMFVDVAPGHARRRGAGGPARSRCGGSPRRSSPRSDALRRRPRGVAREDDEDRPAAGLLGLGAAAQRGGARDGGRPPRLRLGVDGGVLRLRRPDPAGLVGLAHRAGAPRHVAVPALGAHPDRHGHGRADAGPPLGRALRARASGSRGPRSSRAGTASRSPRRWPAPASTSTSCARCWPARSR